MVTVILQWMLSVLLWTTPTTKQCRRMTLTPMPEKKLRIKRTLPPMPEKKLRIKRTLPPMPEKKLRIKRTLSPTPEKKLPIPPTPTKRSRKTLPEKPIDLLLLVDRENVKMSSKLVTVLQQFQKMFVDKFSIVVRICVSRNFKGNPTSGLESLEFVKAITYDTNNSDGADIGICSNIGQCCILSPKVVFVLSRDLFAKQMELTAKQLFSGTFKALKTSDEAVSHLQGLMNLSVMQNLKRTAFIRGCRPRCDKIVVRITYKDDVATMSKAKEKGMIHHKFPIENAKSTKDWWVKLAVFIGFLVKCNVNHDIIVTGRTELYSNVLKTLSDIHTCTKFEIYERYSFLKLI